MPFAEAYTLDSLLLELLDVGSGGEAAMGSVGTPRPSNHDAGDDVGTNTASSDTPLDALRSVVPTMVPPTRWVSSGRQFHDSAPHAVDSEWATNWTSARKAIRRAFIGAGPGGWPDRLATRKGCKNLGRSELALDAPAGSPDYRASGAVLQRAFAGGACAHRCRSSRALTHGWAAWIERTALAIKGTPGSWNTQPCRTV